MKHTLEIAPGLHLPLEAVTQAIGILAKRRAGKSYTARRLAEQLWKCGQQVVIVDPKGDTWGIRSSADGKAPGFPVVIIGGERGDVKLEPGSGEIVAKLVVEERVSVLLDLSLLRKHEVATFMTGFLENLYRLKAREEYRTPVMLLIDEADAIAPQKPQKGEERMLGAAEDIVRRGGQRGIGCTLVTQRSAVLNKNVLTQVQVLIVLRTIAPQDLAALDAWIDVHGTEQQRKTLRESLPSLPVGDAWFWSPGWPAADGIFKRVHVLPIETFDSGATPKVGEKRVEPRNLADVDLEALQRQMAETIERAKADDPKELKRKIAELQKQVAKPVTTTAAVSIDPARLTQEFERGARSVKGELAKELKQYGKCVTQRLRDELPRVIAESIKTFVDTLLPEMPSLEAAIEEARISTLAPQTARQIPQARPRTIATSNNGHGEHLPPGERAILIACAQYPDGVTKEQLSILTGYKRSSRDAYIQRLRQREFVLDKGSVFATEGGISALGSDYEPLPTGLDLQRYWLDRLPEGEAAILRVLIGAAPSAVERTSLDDATGYKRSSRDAYLQRLKARKLVRITGDGVRASEELF